MQKKLAFDNFVSCFRKQFVFQTRKAGKTCSQYYTNYNNQQGLQTDMWAMMLFIHLGEAYGFPQFQLRNELKIRESLYEELREAVADALHSSYHDEVLRNKLLVKKGLVQNCIWQNYKVRLSSYAIA